MTESDLTVTDEQLVFVQERTGLPEEIAVSVALSEIELHGEVVGYDDVENTLGIDTDEFVTSFQQRLNEDIERDDDGQFGSGSDTDVRKNADGDDSLAADVAEGFRQRLNDKTYEYDDELGIPVPVGGDDDDVDAGTGSPIGDVEPLDIDVHDIPENFSGHPFVDEEIETELGSTFGALEGRYDAVESSMIIGRFAGEDGTIGGRYHDGEIKISREGIDQELLDHAEEVGQITDGSPRGVMTHEYVHAIHHQSGDWDTDAEFILDEEDWLVENVSARAAANPREAVAEIGTMALGGDEVPPRAEEIYDRFGGPDL